MSFASTWTLDNQLQDYAQSIPWAKLTSLMSKAHLSKQK